MRLFTIFAIVLLGFVMMANCEPGKDESEHRGEPWAWQRKAIIVFNLLAIKYELKNEFF